MNNLAFAFINSGKLAEAKKVLSKINDTQITKQDHAVLQATRGLLAFRQGSRLEGRKLYLDALSIARNAKESKLAALASVFYAIEWLNLMESNSRHIVFQALQMLQKLNDPVSDVLEHRLRKEAAKKNIVV